MLYKDIDVEFNYEKQLQRQNYRFSDCTIAVESYLKQCCLEVASLTFLIFADVTKDKNHGITKWRKYL